MTKINSVELDGEHFTTVIEFDQEGKFVDLIQEQHSEAEQIIRIFKDDLEALKKSLDFLFSQEEV